MPLAGKPEIFILSGVYYILGFLIFSILMGTCGALGATQQEAQQLSGIFSMIAVIPMWLGGFLFTNPNAPIARVLSWFPLTAPTMMLLRLPMGTVFPIDIVGSIVVLVLSVPLITWLGSKLFRYGLLMYGKRPSFKQMIHIMRQA
jgi:ABC-2 type transport system permease protein